MFSKTLHIFAETKNIFNMKTFEGKTWTVYKHISPSNGVYIGITYLKPEQRWRDGKGYKRHPYFYNAILKYGWDNFKHEILYVGLSKKEADAKETELIAYYRTVGTCYNISDGGEFVCDTSKKVYQYDRFTGKFIKEWHSVSECAKYFNVIPSVIANCCNPNYRTKTACNYIFSYVESSQITPVITNAERPVEQYDFNGTLIKTWNSRREAELEFKVSLKEVLGKRNKSQNGFLWKYADDPTEIKPYKPLVKSVIIDGITYKSMSQAAKALGISLFKLKKIYNL